MARQRARHRRWLPAFRSAVAVLVHSNVFIAVAAAGVSVTTMGLTRLPLDPGPPAIVFAVTLFVYSANRVLDVATDERNVPSRAAFTRRYGRVCLVVGGALYAAAVGVALARSLPFVWVMALPLVVTGLYSLAGLQRVPLVKNLLVGGAWAVVPLGTAGYLGAPLDTPVLFLAGYHGWMLTVAAMVFDIKDIPGDRADGVRTLPVLYGPATTRRVAQAANLVAAGVVAALVAGGVVGGQFLVLLAFHGYVGAYTTVATVDAGPLFYGFVVDGEHIFLAALVLALDALSVGGV